MSEGLSTYEQKKEALEEIRRHFSGSDSATQRMRLMLALERGWVVSTFEAMRYLDIYFPPARIKELRNVGVRIKTYWGNVVTESGDRHRVGQYVLETMFVDIVQQPKDQRR